MNVSATGLREEIERLVNVLLRAGVGVDANKIVIREAPGHMERVEHGTSQNGWVDSSVASYLGLLRARDFAVALVDGALLQFGYVLRRDAVVAHKLVYFPCPLDVSPEEQAEATVTERLELLTDEEVLSGLRLRTPLRFDYAPDAAMDFHPASHLHLGSSTRLPVDGPLSPGRFIRFVVRYFYGAKTGLDELSGWHCPDWPQTTSEHDRGELYLTSSPGWQPKRRERAGTKA